MKIKAKNNRSAFKINSPWSKARRWAAVGTLMAYMIVGGKLVSVAFAQDAADGTPANELQKQERLNVPPRRYQIEPGLLDSVIAAFEAATGLQVTVTKDAIRSLPSPGVTGTYPADQALEKMLQGTGVSFQFTGPMTVTLSLEAQTASIQVTDQAPLASPKYTEPLRDIPQTIMVIPRAIMEQQGATTLRDVLRNVPGLTVAAGEGGAPAGDNLTLRGFSARNDIFVDGSRDLGTQSRDPFNLEQVEVTKGPTSAVSGRGSAGGMINMISKTATLNRFIGGSVNFGSDATRRGTADINLPLDRIGLERTAFRLNLLGHHSGMAGRDVVEFNRWGAAPTLAFGLGTPTRLTLSYYKLKQDNISDYGIPWVPAANNALVDYRDKPAPVPRETFYGFRDRDYEKLNSDMATVRVEHDFSDGVTIRNQFRYGRSTRNSLVTPPRFASNDSTAINREMRSWVAKDNIYDNQTDFTARFETFGIQHALVAGANFNREGNVRVNRSAPNSLTTLLNPNPDDVYTGVITTSPNVGDITGKTQAVYAFDTLKFGQHWEATGGARWERFDVNGISTTPAPVARVDKMTSVRAGLVYKPVQAGSIYASYGTSFNPSLEGLSYQTANTSIPPEKTYTIEVGTKWQVAADRLMLSGAIFEVNKDNARTPPLIEGEPPQVLAGRQRVRGLELAATGSITRNWQMFGAYTFMNPKIIGSNNFAEVGKNFQNTPGNSYAVWTTYTLKRITFGGGPRFVGKRYGNNINTRWVDSYWTIDALASVPVHRHLDLRLNLYNLNNAYYFDRLGGGHLIPGAARSVNGTLAFRF